MVEQLFIIDALTFLLAVAVCAGVVLTWVIHYLRKRIQHLASMREATTRELLEQDAAIAALDAQLSETVRFVASAPVSSGVCCCGDSMGDHGHPMSCGHTPVDEWGHAWALFVKTNNLNKYL